jgi:hypothetical protein
VKLLNSESNALYSLPLTDGLSVTPDSLMEVSLSGNEILVYGSTGGAPQLKWVDRTGIVLKGLGEPTQAIDMFRLSPDQTACRRAISLRRTD